MEKHSGHCFCGAVTWEHTGEGTRNLNCHCDECRRGVAGAFSSVKGLSADGLSIEGPWADYRYTEDSSRAFCTICGTRMWFRSDLWPDEVFMNVGALEKPEDHKPDQHVMTKEAVEWAEIADDIPASHGFQQATEGAPEGITPQFEASEALTGRCLCGDVAWETDEDPLWSGHCHCDSCRRATGAPFTSFFGVPRDSVRWSGEMTAFASSDGGIERHFCKSCGCHLTVRSPRWPTEAHLYAASLNDPSRFTATAHFHYAEKLPWVALVDDALRFPGSADTTEPLP